MQTVFRRMRRHWQIYALLTVPLLYLLIFAYGPMGGVVIAFKNYNPNQGFLGSDWVGLKHFERFLSSYQFGRVIANTLRISIYSLIASFPLPVLFALVLNTMRDGAFKKVVQTVTYMPHFISTVVLVGIIMRFFNPVNGFYPLVYHLFSSGEAADLFASPNAFVHLYVWSGVWQNFGWDSIIYLAALASVDPELHESALIDGATRMQRMWYVDFPSILPTATIMLILRFGQVMNVGFEKVFLMQNQLNLRASEVISTYVYKIGIGAGAGMMATRTDFSYATAIGLFNSVINLLLVVIVNRVTRKLGDTSLW